MSELLNSIIEADKKMVDEKKGVIKMAMDKKELEKELELANKGAEVLKERIDKVVLIEMHLDDTEKRLSERINKLEQLILKHDIIIGMHTGHFKEIASCLDSNLSIIKESNERFKN